MSHKKTSLVTMQTSMCSGSNVTRSSPLVGVSVTESGSTLRRRNASVNSRKFLIRKVHKIYISSSQLEKKIIRNKSDEQNLEWKIRFCLKLENQR